MRSGARWFNLLRHFVVRDLKQRYLGSFSGGLWAVAQPLLLLAVYAVVFVQVLRVPRPQAIGVDFVPFLVCGLWPWTAFAEALNRGTNAIPEHAGLLAKVALPREVLVLAPVTSSFILHGIGFLAVLAVLALMGKPFHADGLLVALPMFFLLFLFTVGLCLVLASLQVFVRDLAHVLTQFLSLLFFLTPVFYSRESVPPQLAAVLDINPVSAFIDGIRAPMLAYTEFPLSRALMAVALAATSLLLGIAVFRRLSHHFEDFL
jgi:lipopolysaccharide transport system permease protein